MTIRAYRVSEVAEMLSTSEDTLLREIRAGKLHAFKIGVQFRILHDDLERYIEVQRVPIIIPKPPGWEAKARAPRYQLSEAGQQVLKEIDEGIRRKREREAKQKAQQSPTDAAKRSILETSERLKQRSKRTA